MSYFLIWLIFNYFAYNVTGKGIHHDEICGGFDGRRLYLELGEHGTLVASNTNKSNDEMSTMNYRHCTLEIITCPSCVISIQFSYLNIASCFVQNSSKASDCECDYVWIYDSTFENVSGQRFCGTFIESSNNSLTYKSKTRSATIKFINKQTYDQAFVLKYFSERNRHFMNDYPKRTEENVVDRYLTSPFFPQNYPRDLSVEYIINCKTIDICKIKFVFTDFQISRSSLIELFDWNGQRIFVTTGSLFRPPILISNGPSVVIRFYANGGSNTGFKLQYIYLLGDQYNVTTKINTDCGGLVDNFGGAITMMQMTEDGDKMYNCFWLIKPPQGYLHMKTHLYVKVTKFQDLVRNSILILKEGLTSEGFLLANITYPNSLKIREHIVSIHEGIYLSLSAIFNLDSKLEIVYAAFNYKDCAVGSDFLCQNQRCISAALRCDSFDNCGDGSDEPEICQTDNKRNGFPRVPNFYFPKIERDFGLKTATIIFIFSSLALMCLIISLTVLLYRINMRGNNRRNLQSHLQSINDLLEDSSRVEEVEIIISDDDPPNYEAPPDYADVVKTVDNSNGDGGKLSKKLIKKKLTNRLLTPNDDLDTSSLSTIGSTSNLLPESNNVNNTLSDQTTLSTANGDDPKSTIGPEPPIVTDSIEISEDNSCSKDLKIVKRWLGKDREFEFNPITLSHNERIGIFSYLHSTNRQHCLSDSDLSSVMSFSEEGSTSKSSKLPRSASTEKVYS